MEQDKRHIPQSSREPHNEQTKPADSRDVDKLRENPRNDEKTISQDESKRSHENLNSNSTFARKDEEGMNRVTNEQEQNKVVNPGPQQLQNKPDEDDDDDDEKDEEDDNDAPEIPATPDSPSKNPYEEIGDDPDETKKKIPKM